MASLEQQIFEKSSATYYFSSKLYPKQIREDIFRLYSFVRTADDYVDCAPQKVDEFTNLCRMWDAAKLEPKFDTTRTSSDTLDERVVKNMVSLVRTYQIDPAWVEAFLASMQSDIDRKTYKTLDESLVYVYGSAEVIGLMMSKIMGLPDEALPYARLQGRAMQWVNFIRDIQEDNDLWRQYFPSDDLALFHLQDLTKETATANKQLFVDFMNVQLGHYRDWQDQASEGFKYIPKRLQIPLKTAASMYDWTAKQIAKDPFIVFEKQVRPRKNQIFRTAASHAVKRKSS